MRIGIYIGRIEDATRGGGATFQTSILNEFLKKTNSNHEFYIFYKSKKNLFEDNKNIKFVNLAFKFKHLITRKGKSHKLFLNEKVLEHNIELVWFLVPSYYFIEAPFVLTVWDLEHRLQPYFPEVSLSGWTFDSRESFYKNAIPKATYITIGTEEGAKQIEHFYGFPIERIKILPFSTPQFVYSEKEDDTILAKNELEKNQYLFYPAQFWPHKNHIRLVKSLDILRKQGINLKIAFSGSDKGNMTYIKEKVKEYNLENSVKFLGFVSESELISLYKNAFAMTYLSVFGPNNIPPLEAMALDCPVICANARGMEEQLKNAALFFERTDEKDLAEKIEYLLENKLERKNLIERGKELSTTLSPDKYVSLMIKIADEFVPLRECWSSTEKYVHL